MKISTFNGSEMGPHAGVYIFFARYFYLFAFIFLILLFYILVFCLLLRVFETPLFKPRILVPSFPKLDIHSNIQISRKLDTREAESPQAGEFFYFYLLFSLLFQFGKFFEFGELRRLGESGVPPPPVPHVSGSTTSCLLMIQ